MFLSFVQFFFIKTVEKYNKSSGSFFLKIPNVSTHSADPKLLHLLAHGDNFSDWCPKKWALIWIYLHVSLHLFIPYHGGRFLEQGRAFHHYGYTKIGRVKRGGVAVVGKRSLWYFLSSFIIMFSSLFSLSLSDSPSRKFPQLFFMEFSYAHYLHVFFLLLRLLCVKERWRPKGENLLEPTWLHPSYQLEKGTSRRGKQVGLKRKRKLYFLFL